MSENSFELVPNLVRGRKTNGRCVYDKAAKRELVRRCLLPGVSLAKTAMEHGVNANLLRKWVVAQTGIHVRKRRALLPSVPQVPLLQVSTSGTRAMHPVAHEQGYLELVVTGGSIRVHGRIDAQMLSLALDCLARRT